MVLSQFKRFIIFFRRLRRSSLHTRPAPTPTKNEELEIRNSPNKYDSTELDDFCKTKAGNSSSEKTFGSLLKCWLLAKFWRSDEFANEKLFEQTLKNRAREAAITATKVKILRDLSLILQQTKSDPLLKELFETELKTILTQDAQRPTLGYSYYKYGEASHGGQDAVKSASLIPADTPACSPKEHDQKSD